MPVLDEKTLTPVKQIGVVFSPGVLPALAGNEGSAEAVWEWSS